MIKKPGEKKSGDKRDFKRGRGGYVDVSSGRRRFRFKIPWLKLLSVLGFSILGVCGGVMIYVYNTLNSFNYDDLESESGEPNVSEAEDSSSAEDDMVLNVLLLGTDKIYKDDSGRSDTILILSLDTRHKKIKLTSLMRDTWVKIPGRSTDRLNAAYSYGGAKLSIETVERNFGIHIDRYASVDFDSFIKIVDVLGGIDLELTASEAAYINKYSGDRHILKGSGVMHLTGLQALHHARNRNSTGSDYDRTERQRTVIMTIFNKMKSANLTQITKIISDVAPMITTNFKTSEITKLAKHAATYLGYEFAQFRIPTDDNVKNETIDQKMVLVIPNLAKAKLDLLQFIYEETAQAKTAQASRAASRAKKRYA